MKELEDKNFDTYNFVVQANSVQFQPSSANKGQQPHQMSSIVILNAIEYASQGALFACYYPPNSLVSQPLKIHYQADQLALIIESEGQPLKFS